MSNPEETARPASNDVMDLFVRWLAVAAAAGMYLVIVMGATVTNTGSSEGCGRSWPLCNGQFVPEFTVSSAIEYSHRAVTGVEGILVVSLSLLVALFRRQHREALVLVPLMLVTLMLQAGLGAVAVLYPQTPAVLATHFGVSLLAFTATFLTAAFVWELGGPDAVRNRPLPVGFRHALVGILLYILLVVYLGAYVRHAGVSLGCVDWPLCNGTLFPGFTGSAGIAFTHRLAALGAVLLLGWLVRWSWSVRQTRPDLTRASFSALALVLLQSLSGAVVVVSRLSLFSTLAHAGIMALLFAALGYLLLHACPTRPPKPYLIAATSPIPASVLRD